MDIVIFGCGAIGSVIATLIKISKRSQNHNIYLVGREKIIDKMMNEGIIYTPYRTNKNDVPIKDIINQGFIGISDMTKIKHADIVFLTMKANDLENALNNAKIWLQQQKPIVIISMNGLGLKEIVKRFIPDDRIIEFSVGYPSKIEVNHVTNTGETLFFQLHAIL
jgi:ketopantoate reductase